MHGKASEVYDNCTLHQVKRSYAAYAATNLHIKGISFGRSIAFAANPQMDVYAA